MTILLLVAEDDALVRETLSEMLPNAEFEIVFARNGIEALAELGKGPHRFRAVVADIKLGSGPDGWEVGRRARVLVPDMPVVYLSGDSAQDWPSKGVPNSVMISKPFPPAQLINAISTLITDVDTRRAR